MYSGVMLTLLLPLLAFISSTPLSSSDIKDTCIFKDGDTFPSFIYHVGGGNTVIISCSNDTCICDGSNIGYIGCQSCCCAIRQRTEACDIVDKGYSFVVLAWAIVATNLFVVVCVTSYCCHQRQKKDQTENITSVPLLNDLPSYTSTAVSAPETVFPPVEPVQRTENDNEEAESQEVQSSSICEPLNPGA